MSVVFLGGSRSISRLNRQVRDRVKAIMRRNFAILVGDANGADKTMQSFLASEGYRNVKVFFTAGTCRNNAGSWPAVAVAAPRGATGFSYYACKDVEMSRRATHGLMLWDGESKGTLNNALNLLRECKPAVVYFAPKEEFLTIKRVADLELLLSRCKPTTRWRLEYVLQIPERAGAEEDGAGLQLLTINN